MLGNVKVGQIGCLVERRYNVLQNFMSQGERQSGIVNFQELANTYNWACMNNALQKFTALGQE